MKTNHMIVMLYFVLSSVFAAIKPDAVYARNDTYKFTHIDRSGEGLSYNSVKCMIQDSRGFIWIGTYKGLNRYDGTRIKSYGKQELGVSSDYINALVEDSRGNILVGTDNGIVVYNSSLDSFKRPVGAEQLNDRIYAMCMDSHDLVWIGSRSCGMFVYDSSTDTLYPVNVVDSTGTRLSNVYRMAIDDNDRMYLASYCDNIYYMEAGDSPDFRRIIPLDDTDFFVKDDVEGLHINPKANNILYVASKTHGLCRVNTISKEVTRLYSIPDDTRPIGLNATAKYLWLSTTSGLVRYDLNDGSTMVLRYDSDDMFSLSDDYVTSVLIDDNGGLWVGTGYEGVNYHAKHQDLFSKFYRTDDDESLKGCVICDFAEDKYGNVWIATERKGLLFYNRSSGKLVRYGRSSLSLEHINALYCDDDWLWIGYHKGICRLDLRTGRVISYPHFVISDMDVDNRVLDIFMSSDGILYACTSIGVMQYEPDSDSFVEVDCLNFGAVEHMVEDSRGIIWLASYSQGVYAYDRFNGIVTGHWCIKDGLGPIPEMTSSMCIDENGHVWTIGFSSGFFRYDTKNKDFETFDISRLPSLPTETFFSALPDDNGNLWLSSDKGLVRFSFNTEAVTVFNAFSGILDEEFKKSCVRLNDGTMMFGSANGFIMFDPDDFQAGSQIIEVSVTDLVIGDEVVIPSSNGPIRENINTADRVVLKSDNNSFGFSFALPVSAPLTGNRLLCQLEGYDDKITDISATMEVYYYNIPAGNYVLKIYSSNSNGHLTQVHKDIRIDIMPGFWQSTSGIFLATTMILAVCGAVILFIYRRQEQKHKYLQEEMERRREKEIFEEKMSFFSNVVHEIKTPLTLIRTPLQNIMSSEKSTTVKEDLSIISNSTDYLDKLVKELLDFIRLERHGYVLEYRNIDVIDRIKYIAFNFSETARNRNLKLDFEHEDDSLSITADPKAIDKIVNNLLHNAVKYAETYIKVCASCRDGKVIVTFANDGKPIPPERMDEIFKPFVHFGDDNSAYSSNFGIGLSLARMLAELHGGSLYLSDNRQTEFVLSIPARMADEIRPEPEEEQFYPDNKNLPVLLLVEDNADLQVYLKKKLGSEYNVLAVSSGDKALGLLIKYKVDIVLTDIVLQTSMDGIELCRRITTDIDTSHIPVIVLSALSSVDIKVKSMENGAIMYIEKPFTMDYLMACIKGILSKRQQLRSSWKMLGGMDTAGFGLMDRDEDFLKRLDEIVRTHIGDPAFSVKQMEEALFMSRSSLTRKLKGLLNITPVVYLRTRRLSAAAMMLQSGKYHIKEIYYAVGFSSPSYFAKCFKSLYGKLPSEYAKTASESEGKAIDGENKNISPKDNTN